MSADALRQRGKQAKDLGVKAKEYVVEKVDVEALKGHAKAGSTKVVETSKIVMAKSVEAGRRVADYVKDNVKEEGVARLKQKGKALADTAAHRTKELGQAARARIQTIARIASLAGAKWQPHSSGSLMGAAPLGEAEFAKMVGGGDVLTIPRRTAWTQTFSLRAGARAGNQTAFKVRSVGAGRAPEHLSEMLANFESGPTSGRVPRRRAPRSRGNFESRRKIWDLPYGDGPWRTAAPWRWIWSRRGGSPKAWRSRATGPRWRIVRWWRASTTSTR